MIMAKDKTNIIVAKQILPWERQPDESETAFEAFKIYRDTPPERRTKALVSTQQEKTIGLIQRWASQWAWDVRVREYDNYMQNLEMADRLQKIKAMNEKHLKIAYNLQVKAAQALAKVDVDRLASKPDEVLKYFIEATNLERRVLSQETAPQPAMISTIKAEEHIDLDDEKRIQAIKDTVDALREAGLLDRIIPTKTIDAEYTVTDSSTVVEPEKDEVHAEGTEPKTDSVPSDGQHT